MYIRKVFFTNRKSQYETTNLLSEDFKSFKNKIKPLIENALVGLGKYKTKDEIFNQIEGKLMEFNRII